MSPMLKRIAWFFFVTTLAWGGEDFLCSQKNMAALDVENLFEDYKEEQVKTLVCQNGENLLHVAARFSDDVDVVQALLDIGVNPLGKNERGALPWELVPQEHNPQIADLLDTKELIQRPKATMGFTLGTSLLPEFRVDDNSSGEVKMKGRNYVSASFITKALEKYSLGIEVSTQEIILKNAPGKKGDLTHLGLNFYRDFQSPTGRESVDTYVGAGLGFGFYSIDSDEDKISPQSFSDTVLRYQLSGGMLYWFREKYSLDLKGGYSGSFNELNARHSSRENSVLTVERNKMNNMFFSLGFRVFSPVSLF